MKDKEQDEREPAKGVTRRGFLAGISTAVASSAVLGPVLASSPAAAAATTHAEGLEDISLIVNGVSYSIAVEPRWTLADLLRDHLGLTGTKIGCNAGECGACTVIVEGKNVLACSQLAVWMDGKRITTVEGLAASGGLDPLQKAFVKYDAPQCGYCTSGQLMSAKVLLSRNPHPTREEVRQALAGNLCRCSNYNRIVDAVMAASNQA